MSEFSIIEVEVEMRLAETYEIAIGTFTALDIADPIVGRVEATENALGILAEIDLVDDFYLIVADRRIVGYFTMEDLKNITDDTRVGDLSNPISPDQMVPVSTTLLDMLPLFEKHHFFFGLNKNEITHVISFSHIDKLPFKLCLFALFMELESKMLERLILGTGDAAKYLGYLSGKRIAKATELCRLKYKVHTPERVLLSTTFIDKLTIFLSDHELRGYLPFNSKTKGQRFFTTVERMRNQIAHGDSIFSIVNSPAEMNVFIRDLRSVMISVAPASH